MNSNKKRRKVPQMSNSKRIRMPQLLAVLMLVAGASADDYTVPEFNKTEPKWPTFMKDKTPITISGRYEGRVSDRFRIVKLKLRLIPLRTAVLPKDLKAGQRLKITGIMTRSGTRNAMEVSRIVVGSDDKTRLKQQYSRLAETDYEKAYALATEFESLQLFYEDDRLAAEIRSIRQQTFARQRTAAVASLDPLQLKVLITTGQKLGIEKRTLAAMSFQALMLERKQKNFDADKMLNQVKKLEGWNAFMRPLTDAQQKQWNEKPAAMYEEAADGLRRTLHRKLYRELREAQLLAKLKKDGSNSHNIAGELAAELPESADRIVELNGEYIKYRLQQVPQLQREQVTDLLKLLQAEGRADETANVIKQWLEAQEKRLNTGSIDGLLETADQYSYAIEYWKTLQYRDRCAELRKQAWKLLMENEGEEEAKMVARQLEQLGWVRLNDRWLTKQQVEDLPDDNLALAMKQGRAVKGMTAAQVRQVLGGEPTRVTRVYSSSGVTEIWVYGEASTDIIVKLHRGKSQAAEDAVAVYVGLAR